LPEARRIFFTKENYSQRVDTDTKKVGGRQVNFTETFENKEFKRKLVNYF